MTPDNAQPTVITAAEFVKGKYAKLVADGNYVASFSGLDVEEVLPYTSFPGYKYAICYAGYEKVVPIHEDALISLYQVEPPATGELASLRAQVARYRSALEEISKSHEWASVWVPVNTFDSGYSAASLQLGSIARNALNSEVANENG